MKKDLVGWKFESITVKAYVRGKLWNCVCDCGKAMPEVLEGALTSGMIVSCGCQGSYGMSNWGKEQQGNRRTKDLTGQRFGGWTVIEYSGRMNFNPTAQSVWKCRCDCGRIKDRVLYGSLTKGQSKSCGCERGKVIGDFSRSHGMSKSHKMYYFIWQSMKTRCYNSKHPSFKNYGARGIKVCDQWLTDFKQFFADVGYRPSMDHSLDRIDNDGNYEPSNMRWATRSVQSQNRRNAKPLLWNGKERRLEELCAELDVAYISVYQEIRKGMELEKAIETIKGRGLKFKPRAKK
jgi:hypothetical protein